MLKRTWAMAGLTYTLAACGGPVPDAAAPSHATNASAVPARSDNTVEKGDGGDHEMAESDVESRAATPSEDENTPPEPLEVRYHVSPEGLRVTVSGIEFEPRATPVRVGGGWGVKIDVKAQARDDNPHVLFKPEQGPMAFYAVVDRGGAKDTLGDQRQGSGEEYVTEDGIEFSRTWPEGMEMKPLGPGQTLELQVGLWGVGKSMTRHRPLKAFFTVKMVGGNKPQPVLSPPSSAR